MKFESGITGRYRRLASNDNLNSVSVILNPTLLIDTRPSGSVSFASNQAASSSGPDGLSLQLRYLKPGVAMGSPEAGDRANTGGVLALADYLVLN